MANVNKVILIGNLTRDPEVRYTPKGSAVAEVGLAVNRVYTDPTTNEKREETTFVDVTFWGRQAEVAGQYLKKGNPVYLEGRLTLDSWDDKQTGQKRSRLKVTVENMQLLSSRGGGGGGGGQGSGAEGAQESAGDEYDQRPHSGGGGGGYRAGSGSGGGGRPAPGRPAAKPAAPVTPDAEEDDIPF